MVSVGGDIQSYLGWKVDYTTPAGEPGFAGPDSISWQVFKNPVALAVGGVAAVLLEFADARIRSGVWDHSVFKTDPIGRSKRTGTAAMVGVFGPQSAARRVIQGVTNMHMRVKGETPSGEVYKALDVELLDWVSATATYGFLMGYHRFVKPLSLEEQNQFCREGVAVAKLYGARNPIQSIADFDTMLEKILPRLEPHPINTEFLNIMTSGRAAPGVPKGMQRALVHGAVDILPESVREVLGLGAAYNLYAKGRMFVKAAGWVADRKADVSSPAAQASERMGLPRDFLWKSKAVRGLMLNEHGVKSRPSDVNALT